MATIIDQGAELETDTIARQNRIHRFYWKGMLLVGNLKDEIDAVHAAGGEVSEETYQMLDRLRVPYTRRTPATVTASSMTATASTTASSTNASTTASSAPAGAIALSTGANIMALPATASITASSTTVTTANVALVHANEPHIELSNAMRHVIDGAAEGQAWPRYKNGKPKRLPKYWDIVRWLAGEGRDVDEIPNPELNAATLPRYGSTYLPDEEDLNEADLNSAHDGDDPSDEDFVPSPEVLRRVRGKRATATNKALSSAKPRLGRAKPALKAGLSQGAKALGRRSSPSPLEGNSLSGAQAFDHASEDDSDVSIKDSQDYKHMQSANSSSIQASGASAQQSNAIPQKQASISSKQQRQLTAPMTRTFSQYAGDDAAPSSTTGQAFPDRAVETHRTAGVHAGTNPSRPIDEEAVKDIAIAPSGVDKITATDGVVPTNTHTTSRPNLDVIEKQQAADLQTAASHHRQTVKTSSKQPNDRHRTSQLPDPQSFKYFNGPPAFISTDPAEAITPLFPVWEPITCNVNGRKFSVDRLKDYGIIIRKGSQCRLVACLHCGQNATNDGKFFPNFNEVARHIMSKHQREWAYWREHVTKCFERCASTELSSYDIQAIVSGRAVVDIVFDIPTASLASTMEDVVDKEQTYEGDEQLEDQIKQSKPQKKRVKHEKTRANQEKKRKRLEKRMPGVDENDISNGEEGLSKRSRSS